MLLTGPFEHVFNARFMSTDTLEFGTLSKVSTGVDRNKGPRSQEGDPYPLPLMSHHAFSRYGTQLRNI